MNTPEQEPKVEVDVNKSFVLNLNKWNYKAFKSFRKAVAEDNEDVFSPMVQDIIESWPYASDPHAENAVLNLGMEDMAALLNAVNIGVERIFRRGATR